MSEHGRLPELIRVWIETSSTMLRSGFAALLESGAGLEAADSLSEADVILLEDRALGQGTAPVVLLTDAPPSSSALRDGVRAILPRHAPSGQIVAAIHAAATGLVALPFESVGAIAVSHSVAAPVDDVLTPRELETLEMMAEGMSNKQ